MSTRSDIIVHRKDGSWARVYCHFDGYLSHNGRILFDHYADQAKAEELVSHGDISTLGARCDKPEGHDFHTQVEGCTVYYGRDRGETGTEATVANTLAEVWPGKDAWTEFTYVWADGKWAVGHPGNGPEQPLTTLTKALVKE